KLLETPDTDLIRILKHFSLDGGRIGKDLIKSLDRLKTGNNRNPGLSPRIPKLLSEAWLLGSVEYGSPKVRSGHILLALLTQEELARILREISRDLGGISVEALRKDLPSITAGSSEDKAVGSGIQAAGQAAGGDGTPAVGTKALDQYTVDLTAKAKSGKIDPVLGRDLEIRQVVDILGRRRQNNPILTGEPGVGKTAVVEGFALRLVAGDVPDTLKGVQLRSLDMGLLQAGAGIKGEFENRLKGVIDEVRASPIPIIMFIDEAHTMIGAGGSEGQNDAANLLKPALARGELRTIAATTWAEYKKYFEKDAALARRFQVVKVEEPTEEQGIIMMRGIVESLEKHHRVQILDEAVVDSVRLSHRYISGRQLPDKSVSVLDTACAKVAIGMAATPASVEDSKRRIDHLEVEIGVLEREMTTGGKHDERLAEARKQKAEEETRFAGLKDRWEKEGAYIAKIRDLRGQLEELGSTDAAKSQGLRAELDKQNEELKALQGEDPMMQAVVSSQSVADVIASWTGIPVGKMLSNEMETVLHLRERLEQRVIGQSTGLGVIAERIKTSRAGLTDPKRPVGVFILVGTSGVGKTETALALADTLYGGERNLISINMSEYQEAHTVSSLKGAPPGYVGYGQGGVLTEAVRRKPYSVVLLDECEKAHPDVLEIFYQVFDKGVLEDGEGREIDFKNTLILLTSNAATDTIHKLCADPETAPDPEGLIEAIRPELIKIFKPALLGRMVVVPYYPISDSIMKAIIKLQLGRVGDRIQANHRATFTYDPEVIEQVASRCKEVSSGARNVDRILNGTVLPEMSGEFLNKMATGEPVSKVHIAVSPEGKFLYQIQ
ncbi:MAG: type VI secretion system ATPase TssH, partial [Acidobacteria bacterium]|nr:type VI secretion system ATPase TssH [Acidobacteriota bacterium]